MGHTPPGPFPVSRPVSSITSAAVAATRDVNSNGGQRETPVRGASSSSSSRDARGQRHQVGQRQGVSVAGGAGGAAARGHPEDGRGPVGRPHRVPGGPLLQPRRHDGEGHGRMRRRGPAAEQRPAERQRPGAAASQPGAVAPAAGAPLPEVRGPTVGL